MNKQLNKIAQFKLFIFVTLSLGLIISVNMRFQLFLPFLSFIYVFILPGWLLIQLLFEDTSLDLILQIILILVISPLLVAMLSFAFIGWGGKFSNDAVLFIAGFINGTLLLLLLFLPRKGASQSYTVSSELWIFVSSVVLILGLILFSQLHMPARNESFTELLLNIKTRNLKYARVFGTISIISHEDKAHLYSLLCEDDSGKSLPIFQGYIQPGEQKDISIQTIALRRSTRKLIMNLHLDNNTNKYRSIEIPGIGCSSLGIKRID